MLPQHTLLLVVPQTSSTRRRWNQIHRKLALEMVREDQEAESAAAAASADSTTNVAAAEPEASAEPPTANPPPSEEVASTTASTGKEGDGDVGEAAGASGDGGAKADDGADADVRRPERTPTTYTVAVDNLDKVQCECGRVVQHMRVSDSIRLPYA